jgi:hypothetical protein
VVKQIVPVPGTLGAFLQFGEAHPVLDREADERMEQAIDERGAVKENPWTM